MRKGPASRAIEERASTLILELTEFRSNFDQSDFSLFTYHKLNDEASLVKKELISKIYTLSGLIAEENEIHPESAYLLKDVSAMRGDSLIEKAKLSQQRLQDERVCRRIGLVMLHANITNSIHDIESRLYEELTAINQMDSRTLASRY